MTKLELIEQINRKESFLCVGLDTDPAKMPEQFAKTPEGMLAFNKMVIEATSDLCVAYKPNLAFYEVFGAAGWDVLKETIATIPKHCMVIADAKRGDIGNTASAYAKAIFDDLKADAITVAPYMGKDSITPFLDYANKWTIVLGLTSNPGANYFQFHGQPPLYEQVITTCAQWGSPEQLMFVVGATRPEGLARVREIAPDHFFLVPGVGAQGGDLLETAKAGLIGPSRKQGIGLLVNASRAIIYAGHYEVHIRAAARKMQQEMAQFMHTLQP